MKLSELNMFDRIYFEADLPLDKLPEEIRNQDISELEFQTSDLGNCTDTWSVSSAGELFFHEVDQEIVEDCEEGYVVKSSHKGIRKTEETTAIHFYRIFECEEKDYWVSFDALFHKGQLVLVDLNELNEVDKEERQKAKSHAQQFMNDMKAKMEKKTNIFLYPFKLSIGLSLVLLNWLGRNLSKIHSKI
tara:strand:- start:13 stop:579 length:567 start_codon:yes stop_codon:yes gene_type:complete